MVAINAIPAGFNRAETVTPHDSNAQGTLATRNSEGLWVGGAGNLSVIVGGTTVAINSVPAGSYLPIAVSRVRGTGTTATVIVAFWTN